MPPASVRGCDRSPTRRRNACCRSAGTTLLDRWLDAFDLAGVSEVLVNTHHLADQVERHLEARNRPPAVRTVYEPELLGSAGTLVANRHWVERRAFFLACNADNLTDFDLGALVDAHLRAGRDGHVDALPGERSRGRAESSNSTNGVE